MEQQAGSKAKWANRVVISIPPIQLRKLKKGGSANVMKNGQLSELKTKKMIVLNGMKLTKAKLLTLLKQF